MNVHRGAFIAEFYPAVLGSVAAADKRMPVIEHSVQAVIIRPRQLVVLRLRGGSLALCRFLSEKLIYCYAEHIRQHREAGHVGA